MRSWTSERPEKGKAKSGLFSERVKLRKHEMRHGRELLLLFSAEKKKISFAGPKVQRRYHSSRAFKAGKASPARKQSIAPPPTEINENPLISFLSKNLTVSPPPTTL